MYADWNRQFGHITEHIENLNAPSFKFSELNSRSRRDKFKGANDVFNKLLEKIVGSERNEQVQYILWSLKRLMKKGSHLLAVVENLEQLEDYSTMSQAKRKCNGRTYYKTFDKMLSKICGSSEPEKQRKFLNERFNALHHDKRDYKPLCPEPTWKHVRDVVEGLALVGDYSTLTHAKRKSNGRSCYKTFDKMLSKACGSSDAETHRMFLNARFNSMHHQQRGYTPLCPEPSWKLVRTLTNSLSSRSVQTSSYAVQNSKKNKSPI